MSEGTLSKQSVGGFKVCGFSVKKTKDGEKIKLILEAPVENLTAGEFDNGAIMNALNNHLSGDTDVGLNLFIK